MDFSDRTCGIVIDQSDKFSCSGFEYFQNMGHHRWALDEFPDYEFPSAIFPRTGPNIDVGFRDMLRLVQEEPMLMAINSGVKPGE